jgi:hypothetical protein
MLQNLYEKNQCQSWNLYLLHTNYFLMVNSKKIVPYDQLFEHPIFQKMFYVIN